MTAEWMLNWYNLIFVVPFALALLYLGLYTLSGWSFGEADAHAHAEVDAHAEADLDHHVDVDFNHADSHHAEHPSAGWMAVLTWFGLGKVPLSVLLMFLFLTWGFIGFVINGYARDNLPRLPEPWTLSVPLAAVGSLLLTKVFASLVARYLPMNETYARRRHEFLGSVGELILPTDQTFGMVAVRDARGELFQLPCRLEAGQRTIDKGTKVKLVGYNADEKLFFVLEDQFGEAPRTSDSSARSAV